MLLLINSKRRYKVPLLLNYYQSELLEAGCDEAGRGCYAGPVFAAAVILPKKFHHPLLNDSKQLTEKQRDQLVPIIKQESIAWAVAQQSAAEIDASNILKAAIKCMHLSLDQLKPKAKFIAIDGNRFYAYKKIPHQTIIKGDGKYAHIAAASILAKTARDHWMQQLHEQYPQYGWDKNKGYGTAVHRAAIARYGLCFEHRKSFKILPPQ
ncbi:MAG: ribonuclease HII [Chitinophagia bacterium]|jgi:ribonuclease HII